MNFYPARDVRGLLPVEHGALRRRAGGAATATEGVDTVAEALLSPAKWVSRFDTIPLPLLIDRGELGREAHGLPADARVVVFCNFNKNTKLDPRSWAAWMEVLRRVPNSVLWLLQPSKRRAHLEMRSALSAAAAARGISPRRLVYAARVPKRAHLARHRHATLFLDTLVYGAHSTATDALRGGLPVLSCVDCVGGGGFASRVGKSVVRSLGDGATLSAALIAVQRRAFVDTAVRLARRPATMLRARALLQQGFPDLVPPRGAGGADRGARPAHRLFDTERFGATFEAGLRVMWEVHCAGKAPMHLVVRPADGIGGGA